MTLENKLGITSSAELATQEERLSKKRALELFESGMLDKLEPYCDALTIQYTVSAVALNNALNAQVDVISGDYAPTGKLSLTMVSDPAVIAITEQEIDGVVREICASPNDVPGYDKDQYIDPAILANVKGGSYAYCDADGNYYRSGFGLNY